MATPAIRFEHVWKRFRLGLTRRRRKQNLRDLMTRDPQLAGLADPRLTQYIWALADVSFEVAEGEAVGIIGPNGSGKSTTLRLASRVSRPWSGLIETRGRIGALIELKAGLHPELTGRENIFLYGSLLGLRRKEIRRRFDQIVEFAELHRFVDTPLKRYSSGMEVRLGFSVAVHLDPDILLIDEVLAVGDHAFQRRCLERMDELRAAGQTIVFVSHELNQVRRLCPRTILLDRGQIRADGPTDEIIDRYLSEVLPRDEVAGARLSGP
jgi:ABC-type polysaccharide/polyol phosphate transport system ATPase subunit